jgi:hypothetical protein
MRQPERPALVVVTAVVQLVAGGLLLACGVFGLVAAVAGSSSATVTITTQGQSTTRVYDTREEMEKEAPGYKTFLVAGRLVDLLLEVGMIAGGVGLLLMRRWGWWLSLAWALVQPVVQVLTIGYLWTVAMPAANRLVRAVPRDDAGICGGMVNGNTFCHIGWGLFAIAFSFYSLLILLLLILPPVRRAFVGRTRRGGRRREDEDREDDRPRRRRDRD